MNHYLDPLLRPGAIAVIGASEREESVGHRTVHNLIAGGFEGQLYLINPGRESVLGHPCLKSIKDLPAPVDHAIFCIADRHIEAALEDVIAQGIPAVTIMSQLLLDDDAGLSDRIGRRVREAGLLVSGPNGMGFYNAFDGVWVCGFDTRENHPRGGNVTLISHSGAGMSGIVDCEERIDFNLAVSTGQEFTVGMADYMDFAIEVHRPRVIGLFMETARDPEALITVLKKALAQQIPVVALKVGVTALSAQLAHSHSGAIAGEDAAYQALFDRYGVQRVRDMDELTTALMLFAQPHPVAAGGLVALHDSGGERQLLIDLADDIGTPLGRLTDRSEQRLSARLDPGLPPVNPLDAWGAGGPDADRVMEDCLAILMSDPNAALGAVVHDRAPHSNIYPEYLDYMRAGHAASGKPVFLVSNRQGSGTDPLAVEATRAGLPVVDGLRGFLAGAKCLMAYRDFLDRAPVKSEALPESLISEACTGLISDPDQPLGEAASLKLLGHLGLPVNDSQLVTSVDDAEHAAEKFGYPVVLKTAEPDSAHKTELAGVVLDVKDRAAVREAWSDLNRRLGPRVLVAPMADRDCVEMTLGMVQDEQFGPLVMVGFGGVHVEALKDVAFALPPFDENFALSLLDRLRQRPLLDSSRGAAAPDRKAFARMAAHFSNIVHGLGPAVEEIDINPVMLGPKGCMAVDALIIPTAEVVSESTQNQPRKAS